MRYPEELIPRLSPTGRDRDGDTPSHQRLIRCNVHRSAPEVVLRVERVRVLRAIHADQRRGLLALAAGGLLSPAARGSDTVKVAPAPVPLHVDRGTALPLPTALSRTDHRPSLPALRSLNAAAISSSVFITKGPRETTGSPIGSPSIQRKRAFPTARSDCLPRSR